MESGNAIREGRGEPGPEELKRRERSAYRWNTVAGLLNAVQSVIVLMAVTRVCDAAAAGVFTLAYANANLFLNVGKFGMRSFQASDRRGQFAWRDYRASRAATTLAMLAAGGAYLAYLAVTNGYAPDKTAVLAVFYLYETVAAVEDVYHGNFQQHDRLDVGARLFALRIGSTIVVLCAGIVLTRSLLAGSAAATLYTAAFLAAALLFARKRHGLPVGGAGGRRGEGGVLKLLKTCLPLCVAGFLLFYIGNAPRYAIDSLMGDVSQAYYGYIAMPVFVVSLLASFIYNPMIASLADQWGRGEVRAFSLRFGKVTLAIVALTAACDLAALLAGVPVLDFLYRADTAPYLGDLVVLVTGGGFLAIASLAVLGITIIRFQRVLVPVYAVMAVVAWALSNFAVAGFGIDGAAWAYFASMAALSVLLAAAFLAGMRVQRSAA